MQFTIQINISFDFSQIMLLVVFFIASLAFVACTNISTTIPSFMMISCMDMPFYQKYKHYTEAKIEYAKKHNYPFFFEKNFFSIPDHAAAHYFRIFAALSLMQNKAQYSGPPVDWIVYMDTDSYVAEKELPLHLVTQAAELFAAKFPHDPEPCQFIGQDITEVMNSGMWFLRNSTWSQHLLDVWWKECNKRPIYKFGWFQDQGPLENALLHIISKAKGITYHDNCWKMGNPYDADHCYNYTMANMSLPTQYRKFGPICLLPRNQGIPLLHHHHLHYQEGHFIRHEKGLSLQQVHKPGILSYDIAQDVLLVIKPGKVLARADYSEFFQIDEKFAKQKITTKPQSPQEDNEILVMENRYLDRIPNA